MQPQLPGVDNGSYVPKGQEALDRIAAMRNPTKPEPYLTVTREHRVMNPAYDQNAHCQCGHPYHRHFDSHEADPIDQAIGCAYCPCHEFEPCDHICHLGYPPIPDGRPCPVCQGPGL